MTLALILSLVLCNAIVLLGGLLIAPSAAALPLSSSTRALLLAGCALSVFAGICSSVMFDRFDRKLRPPRRVFRSSDIIIASMLSPLVFLSFYPLLQQTSDPLIQLLLAYQNGFVFQNIVSRVRSTGSVS